MNAAALFGAGVLVTLVVGAAIALLIYAAVLDGRRQREAERMLEPTGGDLVTLARPDPAHPFDLRAS